MIQNLTKHSIWIKDRIFNHIIDSLNKKMTSQATYCMTLTDLASDFNNKASIIQLHYKSNTKHPQLLFYSTTCRNFAQQLKLQLTQLQTQRNNQEQTYLYTIQSLKLSYISNQSKIIQYTQKELLILDKQLDIGLHGIQQKYKEIQKIKQETFYHMLEILNNFDHETIRYKYSLPIENIHKNNSFTFLGRSRKVINQSKLEIVRQIQKQVIQSILGIRCIQKQREQLIHKICQKMNNIQKQKIKTLQLIQNNFKTKPQPIPYQINFFSSIILPKQSTFILKNTQYLQHYSKSIYYLLNPHPQNQLLLQHRDSLANKLTSSLKDNRQAHIFKDNISLHFQIGIGKEIETDYQGYVEFLEEIKIAVATSYPSQEESKIVLLYFKQSIHKRPLRQVFLFYLYQLSKQKKQLTNLLLRQKQLLQNMIITFLDECLTFYDSQSAIKLLMLLYHLELQGKELYLTIIHHNLWKHFQFWETSFIQSAYEYFEMTALYYQKVLESKPITQNTGSWSNFFKVWPNRGKKEENNINTNGSNRSGLKDFYREVVKNLSLIYLANMEVIGVSKQMIGRFRRYILQAVRRLEWGQDFVKGLSVRMETMAMCGEKELLRLLRDGNILEKLMSKLIGKSEEEEGSVPLSKSISDWMGNK